MLKLHHYRNNIWTVCVRLVLAEKGLDYEMVHVDLFAGEQLKPEFVALNPYHKVPLLQDGAAAVPESWIINEYLEDRYPSPPLLPRDPGERARVIVDYANRFFFPHVYDLLIELVVKPRIPAMGEPSPEAVTKSKEALPAAFERLERELDGRDFFAGDFSIVDCEITPFVAGLPDAGMAIPPKCGNLRRWLQRVRERPTYRAAEVDSRFTAMLLRGRVPLPLPRPEKPRARFDGRRALPQLRPSPIHHQLRPRRERRILGSQEQHCPPHLLRLPHPLHRNHLSQMRLHRRDGLLVEPAPPNDRRLRRPRAH
jgi:glutathione S-transferase